ncbi:MAG: hypothetical protein ACJ76U_05160 [Gaiellaceae bacterium]
MLFEPTERSRSQGARLPVIPPLEIEADPTSLDHRDHETIQLEDVVAERLQSPPADKETNFLSGSELSILSAPVPALQMPADDGEFLVEDLAHERPHFTSEVPLDEGEVAVEVVVPLDESGTVLGHRGRDAFLVASPEAPVDEPHPVQAFVHPSADVVEDACGCGPLGLATIRIPRSALEVVAENSADDCREDEAHDEQDDLACHQSPLVAALSRAEGRDSNPRSRRRRIAVDC